MGSIERIIKSHMIEVDNTLSQILTDLIALNRIIEKSLSNSSFLVEEDHLAEIFIDLAWEKNLLSRQLKVEFMHLENIMVDMINLEGQLLDFGEFEESLIDTNADDLEYLVNAVFKTENLLSNYRNIIKTIDLPIRTVILLKTQRDKIKQGLCLMQAYYRRTNLPRTPLWEAQ